MIAPLSKKQSRMVIISVMLALFLGAMEATVVATALPTIVAKLSGLRLYSWPMSIYILASAVSGPLFGKMSDLYGRKRLFLYSLIVFLLGSILSGFSESMMQLVCFRALQGLGAGGVLPLSIIIAGDMFPLEKRAKVQPLFSIVWGIASLVGPPLGIWLTSYSWRLVFFVNVPLGILAGIMLATHLLEVPHENGKVKIDYLGGALLTLGLLSLELALPVEAGVGFPIWRAVLLGSSFALFLFFMWQEKRASQPILPLQLFKYPMFSSASWCQFFTGMALFGAISFIPLYVELVLGQGIKGTGSLLTKLLLTWVFFSFLSSRLMLRTGYRFLVMTGTFLLIVGFGLWSYMGENPSSLMLNLSVSALGAGMGWIMAPLIVAVQSSIPKKFLGISTSSQVLFRSTGASVGVSVMGAILARKMQEGFQAKLPTISDMTLRSKFMEILDRPNLVMDPILRSQLSQHILIATKSIVANSLHYVFGIAFIGAIFSFIAAFRIPGGKAEEHFFQEEEASLAH